MIYGIIISNMDNNQDNTETPLAGPNPLPGPKLSDELELHRRSRPGQGIIISTVIISLVSGAVGGAFGASYASQIPFLAKYIPARSAQKVDQKIVLAEDSAIIDVVKKASPAVVSIIISKDLSKLNDPFSQFSQAPNVQQIGAGSGFFVAADGLILTNAHVVSDEQASYTVLTSDGKRYDAKVLVRDAVNDLAIVKVEIKDAPTAPLGDSDQLQIGQRVVAIGNSLGQYQNTVTSGIVSGIGRSVTAGSQDGSEQLEGAIQTDAAINPGNSGGPLLNIDGQVIGINTAIDREGQLVGFALPVNDAKRALESFQKDGRIVHPFLGVRYVLITPALASQQSLPKDYGALVVRGQAPTDLAVIPGSPADKAGIVENDIILEVNNTRVDENNSLIKLLKGYKVGDTINLKVYHKTQEKFAPVTLQERAK